MNRRIESLLEVWFVDEWKDGSVWKAHKVCEAWIPMPTRGSMFITDPRDMRIQYVPLSSDRIEELEFKTMRTVIYE